MPEEDNVYAQYTPPSTGGLFHKFEDKVQYTFRLLSDPVVFESIYVDKEDPSKETQVSTKYAWFVWNIDEKKLQILQLPVTPYKQIAAIAVDPDYGNPLTYNLKFTRTGKSRDTVYSIIASPRKSVTAEEYPEAIAAMMEHDLIEKIKGDNTRNVFWLKDVVKGTAKPISQAEVLQAAKTADDLVSEPAKTEDNLPTDEDMKKPLDLSEIPF